MKNRIFILVVFILSPEFFLSQDININLDSFIKSKFVTRAKQDTFYNSNSSHFELVFDNVIVGEISLDYNSSFEQINFKNILMSYNNNKLRNYNSSLVIDDIQDGEYKIYHENGKIKEIGTIYNFKKDTFIQNKDFNEDSFQLINRRNNISEISDTIKRQILIEKHNIWEVKKNLDLETGIDIYTSSNGYCKYYNGLRLFFDTLENLVEIQIWNKGIIKKTITNTSILLEIKKLPFFEFDKLKVIEYIYFKYH